MPHAISDPSGTSTLHHDAETALKGIYEDLRHSPAAQNRAVDLVRLLIDKKHRLVLYLGSGCNKGIDLGQSSGYRGLLWKELLQGLLNGAPPHKRDDLLRSSGRRGETSRRHRTVDDLFQTFADRLQVAWFVGSCFDTLKERDSVLRHLVEPPTDAPRTSSLHTQLLSLPFDDIVTTNYDSNIMHFLDQAHIQAKEIVNSDGLSHSLDTEVRHRLFYLHGKAGVSPLVLDRFDYARLLSERDGILDYVTYLLRDSHIIYVGFGMDDPTFNLMETRLHAMHGTNRPQSFAFVSSVTEQERNVWHRRRLEILDYGEKHHERLPRLLQHINVIWPYVRDSEPDIKETKGLTHNATQYYMDQALRLYADGLFAQSLRRCRAALSSTLFKPRVAKKGTKGFGVMSFEDMAATVDARIRLALNHYKLQRVSDEKEGQRHTEYLAINIEGADAAINEMKTHHTSTHAPSIPPYGMLALEHSLTILKARTDYHRGQFEVARALYSGVASQNTYELMRRANGDTPITVIWKLKLAEGYYYSRCQISRIEYQLLDERMEDPLKRRSDEIQSLDSIIEDIQSVRDYVESTYKTCGHRPEWPYYQNSLCAIQAIAMWTRGRHALRVCQDLIPNRDERTSEVMEMLTEAVAYLAREPPPGRNVTWQASPRWRALRHRYECRGYAMKWVISRALDNTDVNGDEDLVRAYEAIQQAIDESSGHGLERQRVASLLEAARLNILVLFGERFRQGRTLPLRGSPLSFAAGLHYLDKAFCEFGSKNGGHLDWLEILGGRLAAYFKIVADPRRETELRHLHSDTLKELFQMTVDEMIEHVAEQYSSFGSALGAPGVFAQRINGFRRTAAAIRAEIGSSGPIVGV